MTLYDLFEHAPHYGDERTKYLQRVNGVKLEKDLNGDDIKQIVAKKILDPYKYTTERTLGGINNNPFDMAIGNPKTFELIGLEIKGDTDNFDRLKTQLDAYTFCFASVFLVLHKKEAPSWLPAFCGVLRVFENGDVIEESSSLVQHVFEIGTDWDWESIAVSNKIALKGEQIKNGLSLVADIRKNVIYNRLFATRPWGSHQFNKDFVEISEKQKELLIDFDVPYQLKKIKKEVRDIDKKLGMIKSVLQLKEQKG